MPGIQFIVPTQFSGPNVGSLPRINEAIPGPWDRRWLPDLIDNVGAATQVPEINGNSPLSTTGSLMVGDKNNRRYVEIANSASKPLLSAASPQNTAGGPVSALVVLEYPNAHNAVAQYAMTINGATLSREASSGRIQIAWSPYTAVGATAALDAGKLAVVGFSNTGVAGTNVGVWVNSTKASVAGFASTAGGVNLNPNTANNAPVRYYDVLVCNEALSDAQMTEAIDALKARYAIA